MNLSHWDAAEIFSGEEAATLAVGLDPSDPKAEIWKAKSVLARMVEGHRIARVLVSSPWTPDEFKVTRNSRPDALFSIFFDLYPVLQKGPWPSDIDRSFELPHRFAGPEGEFQMQRFSRAELQRWFAGVGIRSVYQFQREQVVAIDEPLPIEKPLSTIERRKLLTIIAVLCKEAKLDYRAATKTAEMIESTAALMGVSIGKTTIRDCLKEIPDALGTRTR